MKIRKHKNNRTFRIAFRTRSPVVKETHLRKNGTTEKVETGGILSPMSAVLAVGSDKGSVRRAFLFGRDASNTLTSIRPV